MKELFFLYLPWVLSVTTLVQSYLLGNKSITGWVVGLGSQVLWTAYVLGKPEYGLLPLNIGLWILYIRNYLRWKRGDTNEQKIAWLESELEWWKKEFHKMQAKWRRSESYLSEAKTTIYYLRSRDAQKTDVNKTPASIATRCVVQAQEAPAPAAVWPFPVPGAVCRDDQPATPPPAPFVPGGAVQAFAGGGADGEWVAQAGTAVLSIVDASPAPDLSGPLDVQAFQTCSPPPAPSEPPAAAPAPSESYTCSAPSDSSSSVGVSSDPT